MIFCVSKHSLVLFCLWFFCAESMKNFLLVENQILCLQSKIIYSSLQKQKKKSLIIWNVVMFRELYSNELHAVHDGMDFNHCQNLPFGYFINIEKIL